MKSCCLIICCSCLSLCFTSDTYPQMSLEWAKTYHSNYISPTNEQAVSLCTDDFRNVYVAGTGGGGVYKILKYDLTGNLVWERYYSSGIPGKILYVNGNIYISGSGGLIRVSQEGNIFLMRSGAFANIIVGQDGFIYGSSVLSGSVKTEKFDRDGNSLWNVSYGSSPYSYTFYNVFQGIDNKISIIGKKTIIVIFAQTSPMYLTYDSSGNMLYDGTNPYGSSMGVRDDFSHHNFLAGYTQPSAWQSTLLLYKMNTGNSIVDTIMYDGEGNGRDEPFEIVSDNGGSIYVACQSWGVSVDYDFVVLKFNTNGGLIWEYRYNGSENSYDAAMKIKLGSDGNVYASGVTTINSRGLQIRTVRISPGGQLLWADNFSATNPMGLSDTNIVSDLQLDSYNNVYLCGRTRNNATHRDDFVTLKYSDPTSVSSSGSRVDNFVLFENFPNPFNPVANIRFKLFRNSFVKIKIFDAQGKLLGEPVSKEYYQGEHFEKWDASSFPSGVYFISFEADDFRQVNKAVLLR